MSRCRSCQALVLWVETEARDGKPGKKMPLDADPGDPAMALEVTDGNLAFVGVTDEGTPIVRYVTGGRHRTHFQTCPNAKEHRK